METDVKKEETKKQVDKPIVDKPIIKEEVFPPNTILTVKKDEKTKFVNSNDIVFWKQNGWKICK